MGPRFQRGPRLFYSALMGLHCRSSFLMDRVHPARDAERWIQAVDVRGLGAPAASRAEHVEVMRLIIGYPLHSQAT